MRVQHNIIAMNSYRNYNSNTKNVSRNLEKLSSGYKINRAGDDAAGLAISEKMRAQITGLEGAQKNAKDGISLVQTAEGALTEVHSMLNRMYSLAEQSANGTYDNTTDRAQLQKEVDKLRDEIDRIADSSNFNGIKLLDGSMSGNSQVKNLAVTESVARKGVYTSAEIKGADADFSTAKADDIGKSMDYTVTWTNSVGETKHTTVSMTFQGDGTGIINSTKNKNYLTDANGTKYNVETSGKLSATNLQNGILAGLQRDEELSAAFDMKLSSGKIEFTAKVAGQNGAVVTGVGTDETFSFVKGDVWEATESGAITITKESLDSMQKFDASKLEVGANTETLNQLKAKIFEIDNKKFLVSNALTDDQVKSLKDSGVDAIIDIGAASVGASNVSKIAAEVTRVTGMATMTGADVTDTSDTGISTTDILFKNDHLRISGSALTLQIGDTAESYNKMDVEIGDVHASKLGSDDLKLDAVDIGKQDGAQAAMNAIKAAINSVSDIRGTLGATQNRLDHTINNLSVMQENIQDAESTIRDTDVADEMMKYTKNSILIQSAQAMLAQANQQPQGVLQLLQ